MKQFDLTGIGSSVELGKGGSVVQDNNGNVLVNGKDVHSGIKGTWTPVELSSPNTGDADETVIPTDCANLSYIVVMTEGTKLNTSKGFIRKDDVVTFGPLETIVSINSDKKSILEIERMFEDAWSMLMLELMLFSLYCLMRHKLG